MFSKTTGDAIKVWLEIITLIAVGLLFLIVIAWPKTIKSWCKSAEFSECTVLGNKITEEQKIQIQVGEQQAAESNISLAKVSSDIQSLKKSFDLISSQLSEDQRKQLDTQLNNAEASAKLTEIKVNKSLQTLAPIIDEIASNGSWAIVFGGDSKYSDAIPEITKAKKIGFSSAGIYVRFYGDNKKSFRSIIPFASREAARNALVSVNAISVQKDAYIVNLNNWCSKPRQIKNKDEEYIECAT